MLVMPLRVTAPCTGPRTFPFPHTSLHRSSNRLPSLLRPGAAWLPSCCGGREATLPLSFRAFLPLSFRAQSRKLSPAGTFQPPCSNRLILKRLQNISWKVPRKNMPPSRLGFVNNSHSTIYETEAGRWREGHDPRAAKQKKQAGAGRE